MRKIDKKSLASEKTVVSYHVLYFNDHNKPSDPVAQKTRVFTHYNFDNVLDSVKRFSLKKTVIYGSRSRVSTVKRFRGRKIP